MAAEPDEFRDTVEQWPRMTREQLAAVVHRLVARSRDGDEVTCEMAKLLTLLKAAETFQPGHQSAVAADRPTRL